MIGFARPLEPAALAEVRAAKLTAARASMGAGGKVDFTEYDIVKPALFDMQHGKCCYCEKREEQAKYRDVEHYRPKSPYWWLAWTWENLLFACIDCNREQKRGRFPLSPGDVRLSAEEVPPGTERPLILDPSDPTTDPSRHIEFRRDRVSGRERWVPYGVTDGGTATVTVCGLDRPNLLDLYADHVTHRVRPRAEPVLATPMDAQGTFNAWDRAKRSLLARGQPFRALSHDALEILVSDRFRREHNLELERPTA